MKLDHAFLDAFQFLDASPKNPKGSPPAQKLSYLLRPAFVADPGKTFVWGDWSAIEARMLPWLAGSPGGESVLDIFRKSDADPKYPDVYMFTAADLVGQDPFELWAAYKAGDKEAGDLRQSRGKVPVLSLGFGGGVGALIAMAANYRVYLDMDAAKRVVDGWRDANKWARSFWGAHGREGSYGLWGAANSAIENPDTIYAAGRVAYVYDKSYLGGALICALPCGRWLTYPDIKWEWREVEDKETKKLKDVYQLTFLKQYGRSGLWHGKLAENITQASAASVLRRTLKRLDKGWHKNVDGSFSRMEEFMPVVMHTHDEIVAEVAERDEARARKALLFEMERNDEWDAGLPLKAEISGNWYYTKAKL